MKTLEFETHRQMLNWLRANGYDTKGKLSGNIKQGGHFVGTFTRTQVVRYIVNITEKPPTLGIKVSDRLAVDDTVG